MTPEDTVDPLDHPHRLGRRVARANRFNFEKSVLPKAEAQRLRPKEVACSRKSMDRGVK